MRVSSRPPWAPRPALVALAAGLAASFVASLPLGCGPARPEDSAPQRVLPSPEVAELQTQAQAVREALEAVHAAAERPPPQDPTPCPVLDGQTANLSWAHLDEVVRGEPSPDPRAIVSGDPLSFNDDEFAAPAVYSGERLDEAPARDRARLRKAHGNLAELRYVRVAKTVQYSQPQIEVDDDGRFEVEPGEARAWLRVFDLDGQLICAVEGSARNGAVKLGAMEGREGAPPRLEAARARMSVDLAKHLSAQLRRAARPQQAAQSPRSDGGEGGGSESGGGACD